MTKRLAGKVALITGATGGIGEAAVRKFLEEGASVTLVARSEAKLHHVLASFDDRSRIATAIADAADEAGIKNAVATTIDRFGGLDVVFANAGTEGTAGPLENQTIADFEEVLRTNVIGVWLLMKHAVEPMKQRGRGSIVVTGSIVSVVAFPGILPYVASKHAVLGMVKGAAIELGAIGIRVNAIGPGPVDNRMMRSLEEQMSPGQPDSIKSAVEATVPMKRYARNEEVAALAAFLASDEASYCTGGIHLIDGGWTAA